MIRKPLFFTKHQLKRMSARGISKSVIHIVLEKGEWKTGVKPHSYEIEYKGIIVIIYEQREQLNVSTCKLNREKTMEAERIKNELNIDFFRAMHEVIKKIDFAD